MTGRKSNDLHLSSLKLLKVEFLGIAETRIFHLGLVSVLCVWCVCFVCLFGLVLEREVLFLLRSVFSLPKTKLNVRQYTGFQKGGTGIRKFLEFWARLHAPWVAPDLSGHSRSIQIRSESLRHVVSPESPESSDTVLGIPHQTGIIRNAWDPSSLCALTFYCIGWKPTLGIRSY